MRVLAITQARMSSTRLPGKVLMPIASPSLDLTVLSLHHRRLALCAGIDQHVIATSTEADDDAIAHYCAQQGFTCARGSLADVLARFYHTALPYRPEWVLRLTADCPLSDAEVVQHGIEHAANADFDYVSNVQPTSGRSYPVGLDFELVRFSVLEQAFHQADLQAEREHVTPWVTSRLEVNGGSPFKSALVETSPRADDLRLTVDYPEDLAVVRALVAAVGPDAPWRSYEAYLRAHPELAQQNARFGTPTHPAV